MLLSGSSLAAPYAFWLGPLCQPTHGLQQLFGVLQLACNQTYPSRAILAGNLKTSQKTSRVFAKTTNAYIS